MTFEIGKQYRIINSLAGNDGKIITIIGYKDKGAFSDCDKIEGDVFITSDVVIGSKGNYIDYVGEGQLEPIDYDGNTLSSWESMVDIWEPVVEVY